MEISSDFEEDYNDRLNDVLRSDYRSFPVRLRDWLALLDASPESTPLMSELGEVSDFDTWFEAAQDTCGGMVGSGRLDWDSDRQKRLAQILGLVRHFSAEEDAALQFAMGFMYAGTNLNDNIYKVIEQIIEPFGRDLWKAIIRYNRDGRQAAIAPAADRVVTLDHNSAAYCDLLDKLDHILQESRSINSVAADPEYERVEAEIGAGGDFCKRQRHVSKQ